jgi:hypothetical protein
MASKHPDEDRLFCPRCGNEVTTEATGALLGFPRHDCETCSEQLYAPLPARPRTLWWSAAIGLLGLADVLLLTRIVLPGLVSLAMAGVVVIGIAANLRIQRAHRTRGRNIWLVHLARRTAQISESVVGDGAR